ncbi:ATP-binding cassette domain-containing protein [Nocardia uniformis]|uniref:ATP-binding cassette domain-containing protein n=1 Tax=Nocardia uniformis TaxID=53432 RepID=A0A849C9Q7_9NOCA|nr:ATP-binding cassette domain-containing protein [Nocardia uniformis]NNH74576.1 ATP-binding cassette domain-containing protein [Nocardia uniformis]
MTPNPAIEAHGLGKSFAAVAAVDGIDLLVPAGSVFALLGPNGAGKTTMVRLLATLLRPDRGHAEIFGHDLVRQATAVRSMIGLTGQYAAVDESLSADENLRIFGRLLGLSRRAAAARSTELLEQFDLTAAARRPARTFSGGMRRRLDLAATLITLPPLIFLDEPTTGLDPRTRQSMWSTVRELVAGGATILLTTQYLEEADALADRIAVIDHGSVVATGTATELKDSLGGQVLRVELGDATRLAAAVAVAERLTGTTARISPEGAALAVAVPDAEAAMAVLLEYRRTGIPLRGFGMDRPDLNEVFFALTNRSSTKGAA